MVAPRTAAADDRRPGPRRTVDPHSSAFPRPQSQSQSQRYAATTPTAEGARMPSARGPAVSYHSSAPAQAPGYQAPGATGRARGEELRQRALSVLNECVDPTDPEASAVVVDAVRRWVAQHDAALHGRSGGGGDEAQRQPSVRSVSPGQVAAQITAQTSPSRTLGRTATQTQSRAAAPGPLSTAAAAGRSKSAVTDAAARPSATTPVTARTGGAAKPTAGMQRSVSALSGAAYRPTGATTAAAVGRQKSTAARIAQSNVRTPAARGGAHPGAPATWEDLFATQVAAALRSLSSLTVHQRIRSEAVANVAQVLESGGDELQRQTMTPESPFVTTARKLLSVLVFQLDSRLPALVRPICGLIAQLAAILRSLLTGAPAMALVAKLVAVWDAPQLLLCCDAVGVTVKAVAQAIRDPAGVLPLLAAKFTDAATSLLVRRSCAELGMALVHGVATETSELLRAKYVFIRRGASAHGSSQRLSAHNGSRASGIGGSGAEQYTSSESYVVPAGTHPAELRRAIADKHHVSTGDVLLIGPDGFEVTYDVTAGHGGAHPFARPDPLSTSANAGGSAKPGEAPGATATQMAAAQAAHALQQDVPDILVGSLNTGRNPLHTTPPRATRAVDGDHSGGKASTAGPPSTGKHSPGGLTVGDISAVALSPGGATAASPDTARDQARRNIDRFMVAAIPDIPHTAGAGHSGKARNSRAGTKGGVAECNANVADIREMTTSLVVDTLSSNDDAASYDPYCVPFAALWRMLLAVDRDVQPAAFASLYVLFPYEATECFNITAGSAAAMAPSASVSHLPSPRGAVPFARTASAQSRGGAAAGAALVPPVDLLNAGVPYTTSAQESRDVSPQRSGRRGSASTSESAAFGSAPAPPALSTELTGSAFERSHASAGLEAGLITTEHRRWLLGNLSGLQPLCFVISTPLVDLHGIPLDTAVLVEHPKASLVRGSSFQQRPGRSSSARLRSGASASGLSGRRSNHGSGASVSRMSSQHYRTSTGRPRSVSPPRARRGPAAVPSTCPEDEELFGHDDGPAEGSRLQAPTSLAQMTRRRSTTRYTPAETPRGGGDDPIVELRVVSRRGSASRHGSTSRRSVSVVDISAAPEPHGRKRSVTAAERFTQ